MFRAKWSGPKTENEKKNKNNTKQTNKQTNKNPGNQKNNRKQQLEHRKLSYETTRRSK